jgi:ABC-type dipeptide/oligopeptide/nickel transport system permease component
VIWRHLLPNALSTTIPAVATVVGYGLGGALIIERVFAWPGVGSLLFDAITGRDYAVVQAVALLEVSAFVLVNLFADVSRAALDPRLRMTR